MIDLNKLVEQAGDLSPLPASTVRLAAIVSNLDCSLDDVTELIMFDQALTMKLLRAANSAARGSSTPVSNVRDAVLRMGTAQVLTLTVAAGAKPLLQTRVPAYGLSEGALWRHSVAAAVAAETVQIFGPDESPADVFTAALLHDVGKLVMGRFLSPEILDYIKRAQEVDHLGQLEAESLLLNANHGELGGLIAQNWKLPPRVVLGITYHHNPQQGMEAICYLTYLANQLAKRIEAALDNRHYEIEISPEVADHLAVTPAMLNTLYPLAFSRYAEVSRRYNAI